MCKRVVRTGLCISLLLSAATPLRAQLPYGNVLRCGTSIYTVPNGSEFLLYGLAVATGDLKMNGAVVLDAYYDTYGKTGLSMQLNPPMLLPAGTSFDAWCGNGTVYGHEGPVGIAEEPGDELETGPLVHSSPNPWSDHTLITFTVKRRGNVRVRVYDQAGRLVATVMDGELAPGRFSVRWEGANDQGRKLPSGTYFYSVEQDGKGARGQSILLN